MQDLPMTRGAGQDADASVRGTRYPSVAVRATTRIGSQAPARGTGRTPHTPGPRYDPAGPAILILGAVLAAEVILPWAAIWLSDLLVCDIPTWSLWLMFGAPPALGLLAAAIHRARSRHGARIAGRPRR